LGFTLIELVVVLALISIAGGVALVSTTRITQRRNLQSATLTLQADLRQMQRLALVEGRRYQLVFRLGGNSYVIGIMGDGWINWMPNTTVYLPNGVTIDRASTASIHYTQRGTPGDAFHVYLRSGPYEQKLTGTVSGGRVEASEIDTWR